MEISAVGRVADLVDLYDERTDQLLHVSITKTGVPDEVITSKENRETKLTFLRINTFEEKFRTMDISASIQLSMLGGLIKLKGSGKYFADTKSSAKSAKLTLVQSISTRYEKFSPTDDRLRAVLNTDVLTQVNATHVVVGIQRGGNVVITVEDMNKDNSDRQSIEGNLSAAIKTLYANISGKVGAKIDDYLENQLSKFSFELYGDLLPKNVPANLVDAMKFLVKSPSLLQSANNGKGKQLSLILLPLKELIKLWKIDSSVNTLVKRINDNIVRKCVRLFDDMNRVSQKLNDLVMDVNRLEPFINSTNVKQINDIKNNFDHYQGEVQTNLSDHLKNVRSGIEEVSLLENVIVEASKSPYSWQTIGTMDMTMLTREIDLVDRLLNRNVILIDKTNTLDILLFDHMGKEFMCCFLIMGQKFTLMRLSSSSGI